jgi:hypothetical protein
MAGCFYSFPGPLGLDVTTKCYTPDGEYLGPLHLSYHNYTVPYSLLQSQIQYIIAYDVLYDVLYLMDTITSYTGNVAIFLVYGMCIACQQVLSQLLMKPRTILV